MLTLQLFHPGLLAHGLQVFELRVESLHCKGGFLLEAPEDRGLVRGVESL
jgi:hypothetical protein